MDLLSPPLVFDVVFLFIMLVSGLMGLNRGFVREVTALVAVLGALFAASTFGAQVGGLIAPYLPSLFQDPLILLSLGGLVVFVVVLLVLLLVFIPLWSGLQRSAYRGIDALGGLVVGLVRGLLIAGLIWLGAAFAFAITMSSEVREARSLPLVYPISRLVLSGFESLGSMFEVISPELIATANARLDQLAPPGLGSPALTPAPTPAPAPDPLTPAPSPGLPAPSTQDAPVGSDTLPARTDV